MDSSHRTAWAAAIAVAWSVVAFVLLVWTWGGPGRTVHQSPDEAIAARGIAAVEEYGLPRTPVVVNDADDMVRPRRWVQVDDQLTPASPPAAMLVYGTLGRLPGGAWLLFAVPALAVGAMALTAGLLLPGRWVFLSAVAPALAFPATYWLLRPWHNMGLTIVAAIAGVLAGVLAFRGRPRWAWAMLACAVVGSVVRPDQTHILLGLSLLAGLGLGLRTSTWVLAHGVAGIATVAASMALNLTTTGSLTTAAIDLVVVSDAVRPFGGTLGFPWKHILLVLLPNGWPGFGVITSAIGKYWLSFGPISVVVAASVTTSWVATRRLVGRWRGVFVGALGLLLLQGFTRISDSDLGATASSPGLVHSYPRYAAVVYLGAAALAVAAAPLLADRGRTVLAGMTAGALSVGGVLGMVMVISAGLTSEGLSTLRGLLHEADQFTAAVDQEFPEDAVIFTHRIDKYLWHVRPTAVVARDGRLPDEPTILPDEVARAADAVLAAGHTPILLEITDEEAAELTASLATLGLCLDSRTVPLPEVTGIATYLPVRTVEVASGESTEGVCAP